MVGSTPEPPPTPNDRLCEIMSRLRGEIDLLPPETTVSQPALRSLIDQAQLIVNGYDSYLTQFSCPSLPIVQQMVDKGTEKDWDALHEKGETLFRLIPEMSSGGYEAVVLCHFARMAKVKTVLEIGMFTGTTTVSLASVPTVEKVVTLEIEAFLENYNRPYFQEAAVSDKIDVRIGDAILSLTALAKEGVSFDMVFIDADKPNYKKYFTHVLDLKLLAEGGFIAVDNTTYKATPWAPDQARYPMGKDIHEFNQIVKDDSRVEVVLLPIRDGVTLIRRTGE